MKEGEKDGDNQDRFKLLEVMYFLLNFLAFPLGGVARMFGANCALECIDDLYASIMALDENMYFMAKEAKNRIVDPHLAPHFSTKQADFTNSSATFFVLCHDDYYITCENTGVANYFCESMDKKSVWVESRRSEGKEDNIVMWIYFSEFPESSKAKDFFELFGCIGEVVEVAIAPRRNNIEKKSGFTRFIEVEDARSLTVKLDNVLIMGKKILANLPRYERYGGKEAVGRFGGTKERVTQNQLAKDVQVERSNLKYSSKEEDNLRLSKAYVDQVIILGSTYNIQTNFEMEGYFAIKVTPLGVNLCLLEESEEGVIEDLIGGGETWWKHWFVEVRRWNEEELKESLTVEIDGKDFNLLLREESFGPQCIVTGDCGNKEKENDSLSSGILNVPDGVGLADTFDKAIHKVKNLDSSIQNTSVPCDQFSPPSRKNFSAVKCLLASQKSNRLKKVKFKNMLDFGGFINKRNYGYSKSTKRKGKSSYKSKSKGNVQSLLVHKDVNANETFSPNLSTSAGQICRSVSVIYGDQNENSDICRNNVKQWDYLDNNVGNRLWLAIAALGVVDLEGKKNYVNRIEELERADKKRKVVGKANSSSLE
ncbi:unnamed protein product [Vicia faba]|uniref:RRM domain-containing protein n=1 Tax=Vicia faba TaxID=3906 RepID=A0AAV1AEY6_VICFA|nr:unnamed protein product [Vicia faba]